MSMSTKRGRKAAGIGAIVALATTMIFGVATAANATGEPPLVSGERTTSGSCVNNTATITVSAPRLDVFDPVDGGFIIDGASVTTESFGANTTEEPFIRTISFPVATFPTTVSAVYWLEQPSGVVFSNEFTFTDDCDATEPEPEPVAPTLEAALVPSSDGSGVSYTVTVDVGDATPPVTVTIGYGQGQVATQLTFEQTGTQSGSFPFACGVTEFVVSIDGTSISTPQSVNIPCPPAGGGGGELPDSGGDDGTPDGSTPDNGGQQPDGTTPDTDTAPDNGGTTPPGSGKDVGYYDTGDTYLAGSPASQANSVGLVAGGGLGLVALTGLGFGIAYLIRQRRTQSIQG